MFGGQGPQQTFPFGSQPQPFGNQQPSGNIPFGSNQQSPFGSKSPAGPVIFGSALGAQTSPSAFAASRGDNAGRASGGWGAQQASFPSTFGNPTQTFPQTARHQPIGPSAGGGGGGGAGTGRGRGRGWGGVRTSPETTLPSNLNQTGPGGGGQGIAGPAFDRGRGRGQGGRLFSQGVRGLGEGGRDPPGGRGRGPNTFTPPPSSPQLIPPRGGPLGTEGDPAEKERMKAERAKRFQQQAPQRESPQGEEQSMEEASEPVAPFSPSPLRSSPAVHHDSISGLGGGGGGAVEVKRFAPGQSPFAHAVAAAKQRPSSLIALTDDQDWGSDIDEEGEGISEDFVQGACEEMCPEDERQKRSLNVGEIDWFERVNPFSTLKEDKNVTSVDLAVKKTVRNYDGDQLLPRNIRTFTGLAKTMDHLLAHVMSSGRDLKQVQSFLWDRFREVRKEIANQRMDRDLSTLPAVIAWNEAIARFFILSGHELLSFDRPSSDPGRAAQGPLAP